MGADCILKLIVWSGKVLSSYWLSPSNKFKPAMYTPLTLYIICNIECCFVIWILISLVLCFFGLHCVDTRKVCMLFLVLEECTTLYLEKIICLFFFWLSLAVQGLMGCLMLAISVFRLCIGLIMPCFKIRILLWVNCFYVISWHVN
jgi:hypothetical protein